MTTNDIWISRVFKHKTAKFLMKFGGFIITFLSQSDASQTKF